MRRVTLGGPQLAAHVAANGYPVAAFRSDGFDDEGKLILKHPDADVVVAPEQADGVLKWPRGNEHLLLRTYTVRRWDPVAGEVDLDFVQHGVGPATVWSRRVQPGEQVQWAGPKMSAPHPQGVDWTLVAGDETALPAIGRWLEEDWPDGARGQVFIEVAETSHRQNLRVPDGVEVTWLYRDGAEAGTTTLLFDAIRSASWWDGTVFAWVAGETLTLAPIRRWLRGERGLSKEQVEVTGYWRRQEVVVTGDDDIQDLNTTEDVGDILHEMTELAPGFALRVATTIRLAPALRSGPRSVTELARVTDVDRSALVRLLRYLAELGIVNVTEGQVTLTSLGAELDDEETAASLDMLGPAAQRELGGLMSLLAAVRTGRGDCERWFGGVRDEAQREDAAVRSSHVEHEAEDAVYAARALAAASVFSGLDKVALTGRASGTYAAALVEAHDGLQVTIAAMPSELAALRALHGTHARIMEAPGTMFGGLTEQMDGVVFAGGLDTLADVDAVHALREASASVRPGGRVLVFGELLDVELADEHDYERDLIDFALTGGGSRTHDEHLALFAAAGLPEPERMTVGWGHTLYALPTV
jgi:NADPH-dependent ferric siderophore reductase/DNA-binding transcriptional ArsR family regulator